MSAASLDELFDGVEAELRSLADPGEAPRMAAYMKDHFPFLGVKSPARKQASKPLISAARRADADEIVAVAARSWTLEPRELQYVGADVLRAGAERLRADDLTSLRRFVQTRSWWDTVDTLAAHAVGALVRRHPELAATMDDWVHDDDIWVARTAILHQLDYRDRVDEDRLFGYAEARAADTEFFIRKALGWALRNHARFAPDAVRAFVDAHPDLSPLTKREALKHVGDRRDD